MRNWLWLVPVLLAGAALAEPVEAPVQTAAGLVEVVATPDGMTRYLTVAGQPFLRDEGYMFVMLFDRQADMILVQVSSGGNACPAEFVWLTARAGDVRVSAPFGTCAEDAQVGGEVPVLTVTMPSMDAAEGFIAFDYDGTTVTDRVVGQVASASPPEAGADPWIGLYPYDLFRGSDWHALLAGLMGEAAYVRAGDVISLSTPMEVQGDWVVGAGCDKYECDTTRGAVAIHRDDGRVLVALRTPQNGTQLFGEARGPLPAGLRAVMDGG